MYLINSSRLQVHDHQNLFKRSMFLIGNSLPLFMMIKNFFVKDAFVLSRMNYSQTKTKIIGFKQDQHINFTLNFVKPLFRKTPIYLQIFKLIMWINILYIVLCHIITYPLTSNTLPFLYLQSMSHTITLNPSSSLNGFKQ